MTSSNTEARRPELDAALIEHRERLPEDPAPGNYVVVDVMHFSSTVVELFAGGAEYVHITEKRGDEFGFRDDTPEAVIGGGKTDDYEPAEGYDFFNSPSYVQSVDVAGKPVSMTSTNGGQAVTDLRLSDTEDVAVYVGGTTNARAVANHLAGEDRPTYLVSAGAGDGTVATEDHIGATLVGRYLRGDSVADVERDLYRELLEVAKGANYTDKHETRRRDVREFSKAIDSRSVVPRLEGDTLYDVSEATVGVAAD
ncbi:2-phosphosulfolactate phosphatase [Halomarina litorea]|uniref:2-phosphosulfolactate phosphatase n=1 Tax=Halomarina litorea TaxID=2961595 RepID=UPI0020C4B275|nr:2-phosphosulfolactate phosphatase [Halomarina sp. BCD28]